MHQRDMERFAFLFLCGKRDRAILLGKEKMTFSDLDRLTYVSDFLGFKLYNLEIWNEYAGQFSEQFRQLELLYDETCSIVSWDPTEADEHLHDMLWSSIFVTLMANKIGGLQFGIYRNCQISSRVFHTAVAALPLTKANRSDFE